MHSPERPFPNSSIVRARAIKADTFGVLATTLQKAQAERIIDLGCGQGEMASRLAANGFIVTGLDPSSAALELAQKNSPDVRYVLGTAEASPFEPASFDAGYFLNSLHHVPPQSMRRAVLAALDLVQSGPNGVVLVIEPLAAGSFFRAMRPVEDESEIRTMAAQVIDDLIGAGEVKLRDLHRWDRDNCFSSLEDFVAYLLRVDPQRAEMVEKNATQLAKAWRENVTVREGRACLTQPLVCWTLARP